jgi:hypothetical protein
MRDTPKLERGKAIEQHYTPIKSEPFGLNKRTRRLKSGHLNVSTPDGKVISN